LHVERLEDRWMLAADLIVEDVWTSPSTVVSGGEFTIFARVKNQGDSNANAGLFANQEATFFLNGTMHGEGDDYDNLGPGETLVVRSPSIAAPSPGVHQIRAFADGNDEVSESDETNNDRTEDITVGTPLSWRSGPEAGAEVISSRHAGEDVWARVEGTPGEQYEIEIWEDDSPGQGMSGDDHITSFDITIGPDGFGTVSWSAVWQGDDTVAPENQFYLYYDAPGSLPNLSSEPLEVSVRAIPGVNAFRNPLAYDWGNSGPNENVITASLQRLTADFNDDNRIDGADFLNWQRRFSTTPGITSELVRWKDDFGGESRIDSTKQTWVVVHGRNGALDPDLDPRMWRLANAVDSATSDDQVLTLDWREGASSQNAVDFSAEAWIVSVANWAQQALAGYGFASTNVNLVGHSFGAVIAGELAAAYAGGVNTILAIDPAEDPPFLLSGSSYSTDNVIFGGDNSSYAWAFYSTDGIPVLGGIAGNEETPTTADEAFVVEDSEHSAVVDLVSAMIETPNGPVSQFFPLDRLLAMTDGPWLPNQFKANGQPQSGGGYEAVITSTAEGTEPLGIDFISASPVIADTGNYDQDGDADSIDFLPWHRSCGASGVRRYADGRSTGPVNRGDLRGRAADLALAAYEPAQPFELTDRFTDRAPSRLVEKPAKSSPPVYVSPRERDYDFADFEIFSDGGIAGVPRVRLTHARRRIHSKSCFVSR